MRQTIVYVVNTPSFFLSHRLPIALRAQELGYDIHVITGNDPGIVHAPELIASYGFSHHFVNFSRSGMNPLREVGLIFHLAGLLKTIAPDLVHLVTIKPVLYGGIAARIAEVPSVASAVAGLGTLFSSDKLQYRFLRIVLFPLFNLAFGHKNQAVIFQNGDDKNTLTELGFVDPSKVRIIRGSGVNLDCFPIFPESNREIVVSFAARLLKDKGVEVFVEASKILRDRNVAAEFWLIGEPDEGNSNSVTDAQLKQWHEAGLVHLLGFRDDIPALFAQSNIITLPSFYGEGLPKVLVEAAACGRAVITTDHPGCRDAVEPNQTGVLVPVKNAKALADAIQDLIDNPDKRKAMGKAGRALAEKEFSIQNIVMQHMDIYQELLKSRSNL